VPDAPAYALGRAVALHMDFWERPELVVTGADEDAEALVRAYAARHDLHGMSVPYGIARSLTDLGLRYEVAWGFRATTTAPDVREPAAWLPASADDEVRAFLAESFPDASLPVGHRDVRRWAGVRRDGRLVACAADATAAEEVGFVASIASRPDVRGTGAGAAVTAWITRALLAEHPYAGLWHMGDNPAAALYERLGYTDHRPMAVVGLPA
jgi:GNAT superfamily N-acetyltransferase